MQSNSTSRHGFTILEMSMVLVIIGLIVGGVLVGQTLIQAARIRSLLKEEAQLQAAIYTFRDKYNCIPGDCANASLFFSGAYNGNGNGLICGAVGEQTSGQCGATLWEVMAAAQHLAMAGLITWPLSTPMDTSVQNNGTNELSPGRNIFGSPTWNRMGWGVQGTGYITGSTASDLYCTAAFNTSANEIFFVTDSWGGKVGAPVNWNVITGADAYAIDNKIDDGLPYTGRVMAMGNSGWGGYYTNLAGDCTNPNMASGTYNADTTHFGPGLVFRADF